MEERALEPALLGVDPDSFGDSIMAADAAMDAAQTLLENYENDPIVSQAYYLICAADAALSQVIEAIGLVDPDDDMNETEMPMVDTAETNSADLELEARRAAIASAEKRNITAELRTETRADGMVAIRGYAAVFNREADGLPFREMIMPGAFSRSLDNGDECYLLINHNTDELPLARRNSGTLTLSEDETGLLMDAVLDPTNPRAAEVISVLTRGDASEMSFAFTVAPEGQTRTKDGLRELRELNIFEVSICTWGAYSDTTVGLRAADIESDDLELRRHQLRLKLKQQNI
jgi:HK97 family phage prohead protease